jgi:serine/threonine protein phosphatase 1
MDTKSRIVIGDPHGCYDTLMALVAKFPKDVPITIAGDMIDRGPKSRQVVQWVIDNNIDVVRGNHEQMMVDYVDRGGNPVWTGNGGFQALESYGMKLVVVPTMYGSSRAWEFSDEDKKVFKEHAEFMSKLPIVLEYKDVVNAEGRYLVVTHSNITNMWHTYKKDPDHHYLIQNVMWGRSQTIKDAPEIYNIHGHTPIDNGPKIRVPFANIDTGCCFKQYPELGRLTAIQYPEMIVFTQENLDDY